MTRLEQLQDRPVAPVEFDAPTGVVESTPFRMGTMHWFLIALGVFCLAVITFVTVARSIQISAVTSELTNPEERLAVPADITVEAFFKVPLGNRILVLPGTHEVRVKAEGFMDLQQSLEIAADRHQQFELLLTRLPGQLDISLQPAVAAQVLLNGEPVGDLPGLLENIPAGQHDISIDAPLYRTSERSIVVQGRGETEQLTFELQPAWGTLEIDSQPSAATVLIDGEEVGSTPLQMKVEEGAHKLEIVADKFKPYSQDFTIFAQQDLLVPNVALVPADGFVQVSTQPGQAAIILDGEYQGTSPMTLTLKPDQPQRLQLYRAGYRLASEQITVAPAERLLHEVSLAQDATQVSFSLQPADAVLYVDGVRRGSGSQTLRLNTLPHRIVVRKAGYVEYQNTLIPTKGSTQVVSVKLLTRAEHFWANVPQQYNSDEGHEMVLFKSPGEVMLGSSRRENGRRSNEAKYRARLDKHFYVSRHEVTNRQFRKFKPGHNSGNYKRKSLDANSHPAVNLSWQDAARYCNWMSLREGLTPFYETKSGYISGHRPAANGYRLLTETEWAWLARNKNDGVLTWPWPGSSAGDGKPVGNFADVSAVEIIAFTLADYDDGYKASAPVGRFPANHRGIHDLEGNVAEWTNDWYSANSDKTEGDAPLTDPLGPLEGEFRVIRGGSWARGHLPQLRLAYRDFGAKGKHDVGFRIARYVGSPE